MKIKLAIALFIFISVGLAQTVRGVIEGTVKDQANHAVPSSMVTVTSEETGAKMSVTTSTRGEYTVPALLPGRYRVEVEAKGFRKYGGVLTLEVDQDFRLDITLSVGGDSVDVTAAPALIRADSSTLGGVIENRLIVGLPLDGRNFYELSLLLPGVAPAAQGSAGSVR